MANDGTSAVREETEGNTNFGVNVKEGEIEDTVQDVEENVAGDVWNDSGSVHANEQDKVKERGEEEVAVSG